MRDLESIKSEILECRERWNTGDGKCVSDVIDIAETLIAEVHRLRGINERLGFVEHGGDGPLELRELRDAIRQIATIPSDASLIPPPRWISVKERLPESGDTVLVYAKPPIDTNGVVFHSPFIRTAIFTTNGWALYAMSTLSTSGITHWLPLPPPPEL